jgi:hypothetical protein
MKKLTLFVAALALLAPGCVNYQGQYPNPNTVTEIVLKENDFKVVKTHMKGTAFCRYALGFIPLNDPSIVSQALAQIRDQAAMDGRPVQLVNYTEDRFETNYLLFVDSHVTITCDAIEFTK